MRGLWQEALADHSGAGFGALVAADVTLEGSIFLRPLTGRPAVWSALQAAGGIYQHFDIDFTAAHGDRSYLEWTAVALGQPMAGVTVLTVDDRQRVAFVAIHHRPLSAAISFSAEMRRRLISTTEDSTCYFKSATPWS